MNGVTGVAMSDCVLKIEKLENGYEVSVIDESIVKSNEKSKNGWKDPWKEYAMATVAEVREFVGKHLDKLKPPPDAETSFKQGFNQSESDE